MKRTWTLLAITLLALCGCGRTSADSEGKLFVSGRIDGDTVDLSSKRPGRVLEIKVREGDSVQAGQVLAVLSHHIFRRQSEELRIAGCYAR